MNSTTTKFLIAALAIFVCSQTAVAQPSFTGLGHFVGAGNNVSVATGISGDGSTVVGYSDTFAGVEVFQWTGQSGITSVGIPARNVSEILNLIADGPIPSISFDGSTIVGGNAEFGEAFRWTEGGGEEPLGFLAGGSVSNATGVSGDGSIVVGFSDTDSRAREAFRWTESSGMVGLSDFPGGPGYSEANEISGDGSTIVGGGTFSSPLQAFRWTSEGGMVRLIDDTGNITSSSAYDVSPDGQVIVGYAQIMDDHVEPFRWTEEEGMVPLGSVVSGTQADLGIGYGVSADGSVVVGLAAASGSDLAAFMWNAEHGMRTVEDILTNDYGLDLAGWELTAAFDVSADGRTIVGYGENPNGDTEAWIAVVPEPSTFALAGSGLFALAACMRRRRRGL